MLGITFMHSKNRHNPIGTDTPIFPGNHEFAPALLDPDLDTPTGIVGPDGNISPKRFSVYRNNVVSSLMEAMEQTYPGVKHTIGAENFATVRRIFIKNHPPSSPIMQSYGDLFPEFLKDFKPLHHSPFIVDLANAELSWIEAYHAPDAKIMDADELGKIEPERLMETKFVSHPATAIISSNYALYEMFCARENETNSITSREKSKFTRSVLITRPHLAVEVNELDEANTAFFNMITNDHSLGESVECAMQLDAGFDISSTIALMLSTGSMTDLAISIH